MTETRSVRFYLDPVSPYTWLALARAESFAREHGVRWEIRPVVYAALLDAHGLVGPVESEAKRRYTFLDVLRAARHAGLRLTGPPQHPFRSIEALRTLVLFGEEPRVATLAARLAAACWEEGRPLTDPAVLAAVVREVGLPEADLARRIAAPEVKHALRRSTDEALARGVFGVPTFALGDELFWGHDRMDRLAERLAGAPPPPGDALAALVARPQGARRGGGPR